jgi:hypothetical protein
MAHMDIIPSHAAYERSVGAGGALSLKLKLVYRLQRRSIIRITPDKFS